jgi:hypothetical protein
VYQLRMNVSFDIAGVESGRCAEVRSALRVSEVGCLNTLSKNAFPCSEILTATLLDRQSDALLWKWDGSNGYCGSSCAIDGGKR